MIKKKILSLLLVFAMVMGILPFGETVAYGESDDVESSVTVDKIFHKQEIDSNGNIKRGLELIGAFNPGTKSDFKVEKAELYSKGSNGWVPIMENSTVESFSDNSISISGKNLRVVPGEKLIYRIYYQYKENPGDTEVVNKNNLGSETLDNLSEDDIEKNSVSIGSIINMQSREAVKLTSIQKTKELSFQIDMNRAPTTEKEYIYVYLKAKNGVDKIPLSSKELIGEEIGYNVKEIIPDNAVEEENEIIIEIGKKSGTGEKIIDSEITYRYIRIDQAPNYSPKINEISITEGPIKETDDSEDHNRVIAELKGENFVAKSKGTDVESKLPKLFLIPKEEDVPLNETIWKKLEGYGPDLWEDLDDELWDELKGSKVDIKDEVIYEGYVKRDPSRAGDNVMTLRGNRMVIVLPVSSDLSEKYLVLINPNGEVAKIDGFEYKERADIEPVIKSVEPGRVDYRGGEKVTIKGENITGDVTITVDGVRVTEMDIVEDPDVYNNQIVTFTTPEGSEGKKIIQVIIKKGDRISLDSYNYEEEDEIISAGEGFEYGDYSNGPSIDYIYPESQDKGAIIWVRGKRFDPKAKVYLQDSKGGRTPVFSGEEIEDEVSKDGKDISFEVPAGLVVGSRYRVIVKNPNGAESKEEIYFKYTINPDKSNPEIKSISPGYTLKGKEGTVKITAKEGTFFTKDVTVMFGGRKGIDPVVTPDGKEILVRVPDFIREETVKVYVYNSDLGFTKEPGAFSYKVENMPSVVTEIDPLKGSTAGGETITLYGNFYKGLDSEDLENPTALWPEIYFGENKAEYVPKGYVTDPDTGEKTPVYEWNPTKIDVILPAYHKEGPVDVKVVNHISNPGITTFKSFTYEQSKPKINGKIEIPLKGGAIRYINGEVFVSSPRSYTNTALEDEEKIIDMDLEIVFGGTPVVEKIRGQITTAKMKAETRDMEVRYDANVDTSKDGNGDRLTNIEVRIGDLFDGKEIEGTVTPTEPLYVSLKTSTDAAVNEVLKISVDTQNLKVERRLSTKAKVTEGGKLITFTTPPMEKTGETKFIVRNADGGEAEGTANVVDPDSRPIITDIDEKQAEKGPDQQPIEEKYFVDSGKDGGRVFTIRGSDFRTGVEVYIGYGNGTGNKAEIVELGPNGDYIVAKSPALPAGAALGEDLPIVVRNSDGGTADSSQTKVGVPAYPVYYIYREATSTPKIKEIEPNKGPALGGQEVTIHGEGQQFRPESGVEVRFGGRLATLVPEKSNYDKLVVITPPSDIYGKVDVSVRNVGSFGEDVFKDGYTYISAPVIIKLQPDVVYSSGGEKVEIIGKGFQDGAKVLIDGKEVEVKFVDQFKLEIVSPVVVLPNGVDSVKKDVTVTNPDGGETTKKDGITFTRPFPMRPTGFKATPQHGRTMMLEWNKVNIIERYRVEISESENGPYRYLAEVSGGEYLARDLKPDTKYYFKLWALNEYGQSQGFATANNKTYTDSQDNQSGEFEDSTENKSEVIESGGNITINYAKNYSVEDYTHDFTDIKYSNYRTITLSIPASVVNANKGTLTLKHRDFELKSAISMFKSPEKSYNSGDTLKVTITKLFDGEQATALRYAPAGYAAQKQGVKMEYTVGDGRNNTTLKSLNGIYLTTYVDKASLSELAHYSYAPGESSLQKEQSNFSKVYSNTHKKEIYKLDSYVKRSGYYIPLGR